MSFTDDRCMIVFRAPSANAASVTVTLHLDRMRGIFTNHDHVVCMFKLGILTAGTSKAFSFPLPVQSFLTLLLPFPTSIMRAAVALAALLPAAALADISINYPSSDSYWVADASNTIQWSASSSDPNVTIIVRNDQNQTLYGDFDIAEYVNVADLTYTVTNVTLREGTGYQVVFVNVSNATQEYASSESFEIKPNGTTPAPTSSAASSTSTSPSGSGSSSGSATDSGASASSTDSNGARSDLVTVKGPLCVVAGLMAMSAALFL
ncbi:hypothetical protein BD626DRAFT_473076 [Schizophyllum amplum]|uniref:Yeast cell wall synthesis Kre9/Knh1-like N-terminal domain-containing protein n=1 Tax=Schizophyllum amplum TaxID=97359 RepID=A0A550CWI8_9AGAR|nr:hypothetical protein BD626DRAFT_473076 [Auriculariopsis ampla]